MNSEVLGESEIKDEGVKPIVLIKVIESESNFELVRQAYREKIVKYCLTDIKFGG